MVPFKIGIWRITEEGIICEKPSGADYVIAKERLTEGGPGDRSNMYDWLVHMASKSWVTREDIYALNTALIYAMEYFKIPFPENHSFVETFIEQEREMKYNQ